MGGFDLSRQRSYSISKLKSKILFGENETIFSELPNNVLANLRHPGSENALLWNIMYPLSQPFVSLGSLLSISPLWGTANIKLSEDALEPYFWGFGISGEKLPGLDGVLERIDGAGPKTEVDLILRGKTNLIFVEAKHLSGLGRCSRYLNHRCPEIHAADMWEKEVCRYWEPGEQEFRRLLNFGERPRTGDPPPPCNQHYQLARTIVLGDALAREYQMELSLWMLVSKMKWRSIERTWLDFTGRIREDDLWRRMRVIAWEDLKKPDWKNPVK
jgi:hypothetical protein